MTRKYVHLNECLNSQKKMNKSNKINLRCSYVRHSWVEWFVSVLPIAFFAFPAHLWSTPSFTSSGLSLVVKWRLVHVRLRTHICCLQLSGLTLSFGILMEGGGVNSLTNAFSGFSLSLVIDFGNWFFEWFIRAVLDFRHFIECYLIIEIK